MWKHSNKLRIYKQITTQNLVTLKADHIYAHKNVYQAILTLNSFKMRKKINKNTMITIMSQNSSLKWEDKIIWVPCILI